MKNYELREAVVRLLVRALIASVFFAPGFYWLFSGNLGHAFYGCAALLAGAMIIAFPVARLLAIPLTSLFWPSDSAPPPPVYGIPESHVKQGRYEEAIREYREIIRKYPAEVKPYMDLMDLAVRRMHDPDLAARIHREAMLKLKKSADREAVTRLYEAMKGDLA